MLICQHGHREKLFCHAHLNVPLELHLTKRVSEASQQNEYSISVMAYLCSMLQKAAVEAAAKAEAQELQGWKKDATAVLAALEGSYAEKMTEVIHLVTVQERSAFRLKQSTCQPGQNHLLAPADV